MDLIGMIAIGGLVYSTCTMYVVWDMHEDYIIIIIIARSFLYRPS